MYQGIKQSLLREHTPDIKKLFKYTYAQKRGEGVDGSMEDHVQSCANCQHVVKLLKTLNPFLNGENEEAAKPFDYAQDREA